jgi:hypothetical protein
MDVIRRILRAMHCYKQCMCMCMCILCLCYLALLPGLSGDHEAAHPKPQTLDLNQTQIQN